MFVIAVLNHKGGVGKTTTTMNLADALARRRYRVCALDLDPQGHLAAGLGFTEQTQTGLSDLLAATARWEETVIAARDGLDLVPPGARLAEYDIAGAAGKEAGWRLKRLLAKTQAYDVAILDCPPNGGLLAMNALIAANHILLPVAADHLSMLSAERTEAIIRHVVQRLGLKTQISVLCTRFNTRRRLSTLIYEKLQALFPGKVWPCCIRECAALAESPAYGRTIFEFRSGSTGAEDYGELAARLCKALLPIPGLQHTEAFR